MLSSNTSWLCFVLLATIFQYSICQEFCRKTKPVKVDTIEAKCVNISWYVYAASVPCDGCCVRRDLIELEPRKIKVTDTTTVNGQSTAVTFTVQRFNDYGTYFVLETSIADILHVVDTDCETYAVVYNEMANTLLVVTAEPEQSPTFLSKLKGVKRCGMSLYEYNPKLYC